MTFDNIMIWYGYFMLIIFPVTLIILKEFRMIIIKIAEKKEDDGKIDAKEVLELIESALYGFTRIIQSAIDKLRSPQT